VGGLIPFMNNLASSVNPTSEQNSSAPAEPDDQKEWKLQSLWRRLIRDKRISHGAFRLWHHYRDVMDKDSTLRSYLSLTLTTAGYLGSNNQCIARWNNELKASGWLSWDTAGERRPRVYKVLNGFGMPVRKVSYREPQIELPLPHVATSRVTGSGNTVLPIGDSGVTGSGNTASTRSKGYEVNAPHPKRERWMIEKDRQAIHSAWMEALNLPAGDLKKRILRGLKQQRNDLLKEMAWPSGIQQPIAESSGTQEGSGAAKPEQLSLPVTSPAPDAPGPKPGDPDYEEWKKAI
jgi:hypothetical protein